MEQNLREQCKAIMLRSGKEVESFKLKEVRSKEVEDEAKVETEPPKIVPKPNSISFPDNPSIISPLLSFPQRFHKKKLDNQFSKFLEILRKYT